MRRKEAKLYGKRGLAIGKDSEAGKGRGREGKGDRERKRKKYSTMRK